MGLDHRRHELFIKPHGAGLPLGKQSVQNGAVPEKRSKLDAECRDEAELKRLRAEHAKLRCLTATPSPRPTRTASGEPPRRHTAANLRTASGWTVSAVCLIT